MTVQYHKVTVSLPGNLLEYVDRRASRVRRSRSQVINEALAEAQALEQTRLAAEGYRFYAGESSEFADANARDVAEALSVSGLSAHSPGCVVRGVVRGSGGEWDAKYSSMVMRLLARAA